MITNAEILQRAKEVLLEKGWHQGSIVNQQTGARCVYGAISFVKAGMTGLERKNLAAYRFFGRVIPDDEAIGDWNDHPERTFGEVMAKFDEAILLAKETEAQST